MTAADEMMQFAYLRSGRVRSRLLPSDMTTENNSADTAKSRRMGLSEIRDWIDVLFKIALPLAGAVIGYYFSHQKQQNDDIKLIVELATAPESSKRLMGASIASAYQQQKRIPQEIYIAMVSYANNGDDRSLQAAVNSGANNAGNQQPELKKAISNALDALPVRVFFQIREEADRTGAENIRQRLQADSLDGKAIIVPGIERVPGAQPKSYLKCFRTVECDTLGVKLLEVLRQDGVSIELSNQSSAYEKTTRPNHFEVWFAPGTFQ